MNFFVGCAANHSLYQCLFSYNLQSYIDSSASQMSSKLEGNLHNFVSWNCFQSSFNGTDSLQIAELFHLFWNRK